MPLHKGGVPLAGVTTAFCVTLALLFAGSQSDVLCNPNCCIVFVTFEETILLLSDVLLPLLASIAALVISSVFACVMVIFPLFLE